MGNKPLTVSPGLTNHSIDTLSLSREIPAGVTLEGKHVLDWEAKPVQSASGTSRTATLVEQVKEVSQLLAERTDGVIRLGENSIESRLRLSPPDLGRLNIQLKVGHDITVQALFLVEKPETAQMLHQYTHRLTEAMAQQGMTVDRIQVTVQTGSSFGDESGNLENQQGGPRRDASSAKQDQTQDQANSDMKNRDGFSDPSDQPAGNGYTEEGNMKNGN
jgi:flagellar hook-length control protein FliK